MTRLINQKITCPSCSHSFSVLLEASINTWLDPERIQKLLDDSYRYSCPSCNTTIKLVTDILINCPKKMFFISTGLDTASIKKILLENNIITESGIIVQPGFSTSPLPTHQIHSDEGIFKEVKNFRDKLLSENEEE